MKKYIVFFFLLVITTFYAQTNCTNGMAGIFPCNNIDLWANMTFTQIGGTSSTEGNDCWGWTDPLDNKEYAIMGCTTHTAFINITNPANPIYLGKVVSHNNTSSIWRDVKVYNNHAFIVSEANGHGMQVFDLTRLRNVIVPQTFAPDAHYAGFGNCHNIAINEASGFAYCIGTSTYSGGPHIVNIQNPTAPVLAAGYAAQNYCHDAHILNYNGPDTAHLGKEIFFGANEDKVVIVDVTNKTNPILLSTFTYANTSYSHQGWVTDDRKYFMLSDELDETSFGFNTKTIVIDITDLDAPVLKFNKFGTTAAIDHNGYAKGNDFHLANYRAGYRLFDITNMLTNQMNEIGFFDTFPTSNNAQFNGAWSVYPFFPSGNIIISDIERGLFIVKKSAALANENFSISKINMYPNPSSSIVTIEIEHFINTLEVVDMLGKIVFNSNTINNSSYDLDVSALSKGVYLVKVNNSITEKLVVN